jgi:hypothetical protein
MASATLSLGFNVRKGVRMICPWPLAIYDVYSCTALPAVVSGTFTPGPATCPTAIRILPQNKQLECQCRTCHKYQE